MMMMLLTLLLLLLCPFRTSRTTGREAGVFKLASCTVIFVQRDKLTLLQ